VRETTDWTRQLRGTAISILDTGAGIRPEDARRLFQPFFSTKSTKGTGLGLWISKGIIQKYDGRIACRSFRHGEQCATCFKIFLPVSGSTNGSGAANAESNDAEREAQSVIRSQAMLQAII
jgi:signal transduction histidine kinase